MTQGKPITQSVQDVPPPGGYGKVPTENANRVRGPSGKVIWAGVIFFTVFGFVMMGRTNQDVANSKQTEREMKLAIYPYVMAEGDLKAIASEKSATELKRQILKNKTSWPVNDDKSKRH